MNKKKYRRIYAVPDIHGKYDLLQKALKLLDKNGYSEKDDLLVFLGDYIDRGPESKQVIETLIDLSKKENVVILRGNHEDLSIVYHTNPLRDGGLWFYNGGWATTDSYGPHRKQMDEEHIKFLASLPYQHIAQGFFFSHAPVPPDSLRKGLVGIHYSSHELTWTYYDRFEEGPYGVLTKHPGPIDWDKKPRKHLIGICGHIHRGVNVKTIRTFRNYRVLDCGAGCFSGSPLAIHECMESNTLYAWSDGGEPDGK